MAIRPNSFNDPALGQAFGNIASLFAPPSAQDTLAYAGAQAQRQEAERRSWLFENAADPLADRKAVMAGVYNPTQSFYAQDQNNATAQRGQDVTANTTRQTNLTDNQFGLAKQYMTPRAEGVVDPGLPGSVAQFFGVPEMAPVNGAPKPLSETEQLAAERQALAASGLLTPEMQLEDILGAQAPVKIAGPEGEALYSTPGAAARAGAAAYVDAGSVPKPENGMAQLADGTQVPAVQDVTTGRWKHAQTGAELPANIAIYKTPAPTGTNEDLGIGKPAANMIEKQLIDVAVARDTAVKLRDLIATSPSSQGVVGWLRGTAQNVLQMGGEAGSYFGGRVKEVTDAIASGAADASLAGSFDPNIPAIEMMANLLAFQYAKTTTGERLSNEMLRASRVALGLDGLTANQASSITRIETAIKQMEAQEQILRGVRASGLGEAPAPTAPAAPPAVGGAVTDEDLLRKYGGQ